MSTLDPLANVRLAPARVGRSVAPGAFLVFAAVLGPMSTVPALRRLLVDVHGQSPSLLHWFVAAGMAGSLLGAPWIAARADARGTHLALAGRLALLDAAVALATSLPLPTALLFLLRPLHGAASMGVLALLFSRFRGSPRQLVSHAGAAAVAALAIGPALGGGLTRLGALTPFRFAASISLLLAVWLLVQARAAGPAVARPAVQEDEHGVVAVLTRELRAPLVLVATQRFALGGLVSAFAVHARAVRGFSDAQVGMCFSVLLTVFAGGVWWLGRRPEHDLSRWLTPGSSLFAVAIGGVVLAPAPLLMVALALAGLGAAFAYAPCLALVASRSRSRATAMALLQAAGGLGMVLGPLGALATELLLRGSAPELRVAAFLGASGAVHAVSAVVLLPAFRRPLSPTANAVSPGVTS